LQLIQTDRKYKDDIKSLASEVLDLSACLADIRDHARLQLLQDKVVNTLQTINDAAVFMKEYLDLNAVGRLFYHGTRFA